MEGASGDGPGDNSQLDNSYLQGQYVVEGTDDDAVASGDNEEEQKDKSPLREQDRFLPIANVARIMKKSIPKTGKIAKDAKECVQECVSEFISFITSEASERCHQEKRKTINGEDILFAMSTLGFDSYVEPLKLYLQKYRERLLQYSEIKVDRTMEETDFRKILFSLCSTSPFKAMKGDKGATNRHEEMDEMGDESYGLSQGLTANILSTDQGAQQGVIFTNFTNQSYAM